MIFEQGEPYERVKKGFDKDVTEQPIFSCDFANAKGGLLRFLNTDRINDCIWVTNEATNYKKLGTTVAVHLENLAIAKRDILLRELDIKRKEVGKIETEILAINRLYPMVSI